MLYLLIVPGLPFLGIFLWIKIYLRRRDLSSRRPFQEMPKPPGWSLQDRHKDLVAELISQITGFILIGTIAGLSSVLFAPYRVPILITGLLSCFALIYFLMRGIKTVHNYQLGLYGEQIVGHYLDQLTSPVLKVYHDYEVREGGRKPWNMDHIVLTQAGIYVIETKTRRKPKQSPSSNGQANHEIHFDGEQLIFPAPLQPDRSSLDQVRRNAEWLSRRLPSQVGQVPITSVLVFPGWFIKSTKPCDVRILNPKGLNSLFSHLRPVLSETQFKLLAYHFEEKTKIDFEQLNERR